MSFGVALLEIFPSMINVVGGTISALLTSIGKTSSEALIPKESTKIVEKLSLNSSCNRIDK
jgi:hypothetical protein